MMPLKIFISYTQADRQWAEWIAWQIEAAGHGVRIQAWDFRPGTNFLNKMHEATQWADVTAMVLSEEYLESDFCKVEWYAGLVDDAVGEKQALLPFRVAPCQPRGLLKALVYADLVGLSREQARQRILVELKRGRRKPEAEPVFPGQPDSLEKPPLVEPSFPSRVAAAQSGAEVASSSDDPDGRIESVRKPANHEVKIDRIGSRRVRSVILPVVFRILVLLALWLFVSIMLTFRGISFIGFYLGVVPYLLLEMFLLVRSLKEYSNTRGGS